MVKMPRCNCGYAIAFVDSERGWCAVCATEEMDRLRGVVDELRAALASYMPGAEPVFSKEVRDYLKAATAAGEDDADSRSS